MNRFFLHSQPYHFLLVLIMLVQFMPGSNVAAQASANEHLAAILILDDSGSMKTNDPTNLRYTAAQLFVGLLEEKDAVGVLRFSSESSPITDGIETITSSEQQARLVKQLTAVPSDGFTDVKSAFEEAQHMLREFNLAGYQVVVIFLTDGKPEIPNPYPAYEQEALDTARSLGVPIQSIALTSAGQSSFLNHVASETGGEVVFADGASDLLDVYLQILGDIKDRTVIGSGSTNAPGQADLQIDPALIPYVDRVSFVISKPASVGAGLINPDGRVISVDDPGVAFAIQDQRFAIYTVPDPAGGNWSFDLSGNGHVQARAILYSRLRVRLVSPQSLFESNQPLPLVVKLVEEQPGQALVNIIGQGNFSASITRPDGVQDSLDQFYDDGTHGDQISGDGLFTRLYLNTGEVGSYRIHIQGYKGSVPVEYRTQFQGIAFPEMIIDQPASAKYDIRRNDVPLGIHLEGTTPAELDSGTFEAVISTPSFDDLHVPITMTLPGVYTGVYTPEEDGIYNVSYLSVDGIFQGLPYLHSATTSFKAQHIPLLSIRDVRIGLQTTSNDGTISFGLVEAKEGIPVAVTVQSTSPRVEILTAYLEDLQGFSLMEKGGFQIAPQGDTSILLHIQADRNIPAQVVRGQLVFAGSRDMDLTGQMIPISLDLTRPVLDVTSVTLGDPGYPNRVELLDAQQGIPVMVTFRSTSPRTEKVTARLDGVAGFVLLETEEFSVSSNGDTTQTLHLLADPAPQPQKIHGQLVYSASEDVTLVGGDIELNFELYEPSLTVSPVVTSMVSSDTCMAWAPVQLTLYLTSTSTRVEHIRLTLADLEGVSLNQDTITVQPGASQVKLTLIPDNGRFGPGQYTGRLLIEGLRPGFALDGSSALTLTFKVDSILRTCRKSMIISGVALAFTVILVASVVARVRRRAQPPIVTGTLIHWNKDTPALTMDVNLTALKKTEVAIGKGSQNDIVIPDEAMQDEHALILVERDENNELRFTLHPKASVRKGYREYTSDLPLEENIPYQMGSRIIKYIRDIG